MRLPPELAFLERHGFDDDVLSRAALGALWWGTDGAEALIVSGLATPETYYRALAAEMALPFFAGGFEVHALARFPEAVLSGIAPLARARDEASFVFAPRGGALCDLVARGRGVVRGLAITTPEALRAAVFAARADAIARFAAEGLARSRPDESFYGAMTVGQVCGLYAIGSASGIATMAMEGSVWGAATLLLSFPFLGLAAVKLAAALDHTPTEPRRPPLRTPDAERPVYTILIALYREGRVLPRLLEALRNLDYPALWSKCTKRHSRSRHMPSCTVAKWLTLKSSTPSAPSGPRSSAPSNAWSAR